MEKDGKACLSAGKDDFDQQTACLALVRWSKYTACARVKIGLAVYLAELAHQNLLSTCRVVHGPVSAKCFTWGLNVGGILKIKLQLKIKL